MLLEDLIAMHAGELFPGFRVLGCSPFRVTRNFDLAIDEDEAEICSRRSRRSCGAASAAARCGSRSRTTRPTEVRGVPALRRCASRRTTSTCSTARCTSPTWRRSAARDELRELRDEPFSPQIVPPLQEYDDIFRVIAERDILLHHPYESFDAVVEFIAEAADDPNVLAIKQTLYRTSADSPDRAGADRAPPRTASRSPRSSSSRRASTRRTNIEWARTLEEAGVHVVYGLIGLKTHCKVALVVRREGNGIRRYVHLSTGNYNPATARIYTDLSYFTARDDFADDAARCSTCSPATRRRRRGSGSRSRPHGLHDRIIALIEREAALGQSRGADHRQDELAGRRAGHRGAVPRRRRRACRSTSSCAASAACARACPASARTSACISIVDRFLEHARIFHFGNGGKREVYLSSADWMPRNFQRRVEVMFPVEDEGLRDRVIDEILGIALKDNVKARRLLSGRHATCAGNPRRPPTATPPDAPLRSQYRFMELAREKAQAGPPLPGTGGTYHVRPAPPTRTGAALPPPPRRTAAPPATSS